jgi:hypothetical protein
MLYLLACWDIADQTGKQIIKRKAVKHLAKDFDPNFYKHAVFKNIFTKDEYPELLQNFIECTLSSCSPFDIMEEKGRLKIHSYVGYNYIICLAYLAVDFKQESIQRISKKSEYYNWLINPETYDYSNFNVKWLTEACPSYLRLKLHSVEVLKKKVAEELKREHDPQLAKFFIKHLY